jgi:hypothetical protein
MWAAMREGKSGSRTVASQRSDHRSLNRARNHSAIGVHSIAGARAADIMPTCPSGGRSTVAPSSAASGSAELGGTIRS